MSVKSDNYPVGATLMFAGILPENGNWLLCDGREFLIKDYPELFNKIAVIYGGNKDEGTFNVPNYGGQFLRGAADVATGVGIAQAYGTKIPNSGSFEMQFNHLPVSSKKTHGVTKGENSGYNGSPTIKQNVCTSGGDAESRPKNVYLNMYIKSVSS